MAEPADPAAPDADDVAAAEAELARQEQAQRFELPDPSAPVPGGTMGSRPPFQFADEGRGRESSRERVPKVLEDLYDMYQKIGSGSWKIRIERTHPQSHRGHSCAGHLEDSFERLGMDDLRRRFGGGRYVVGVLSPTGGEDAPTGYRKLQDVIVKIPGPPKLTGLTDEAEEGKAVDRAPYTAAYVGDAPEVAKKRLDVELEQWRDQRQEQRELRDAAMARGEVPDTVLQTVREAHGSALNEVKEQGRAASTLMAQEVDRLRAVMSGLERENREMRDKLLQAQADAANTMQRIETQAMAQLKEQHEQELKRLKEMHEDRFEQQRLMYQERIDRQNEAHAKELSTINERHGEERRNYEQAERRERERVREAAEQRIAAVDRDRQKESEQMRMMYDMRFDDLKRSNESSSSTVRERCDREVSAIRESERTQAAMVRETAEQRVLFAEQRIGSLEAEIERLQRRNDELQGKLHRPLEEQLENAKRVASLTGMRDADEEGPATTLQQLLGLGKTAIESAPKVLEQLSQQRHQQAQQQIVAHPQLPGPRVVHMHQPHPPARAMPARSMPQQPAPVPLGPARAVSPVQSAPARPASVMPLGSGIAKHQTAVPMAGRGVQPPPPQPHLHGPPEPSVVAGPVEPQPAAAPMGSQQAPPVAEQQLVAFFSQLEQAVQTGLVAPFDFAQQLVQAIGPDLARQLLITYHPDDVIQAVASSPGGEATAVVTRDGQRYVRQVFAHAAAIVGPPSQQQAVPVTPAAAAQPPPPQPPPPQPPPDPVADAPPPPAAPLDPDAAEPSQAEQADVSVESEVPIAE